MSETAIFTHLTGGATLATNVASRVYPVQIPRPKVGQTVADFLPAITYQLVSGPRLTTNNGQDPLRESRYQITCWARRYEGAVELADQVRMRMSGYRGTVGSTVIRGIFLEDEGDIPSIDSQNEQATEYGRRLDFIIWHVEAAPDHA